MIANPADLDPLSLLVERRDEFEARMALFLSDVPSSTPTVESRTAARLLLDVVIASHHDKGFAEGAAVVTNRRFVSHFGDALLLVLKDVLGPDVPISFLARCVDGYWSTIRPQVGDN